MKQVLLILECLVITILFVVAILLIDCSPLFFPGSEGTSFYLWLNIFGRVFIMGITALYFLRLRRRNELLRNVTFSYCFTSKTALSLLLLCIGIYIIKHPIYSFEGFSNYDEMKSMNKPIQNQVLHWEFIVSLVLITPVMEELLFRGILLARLRSTFNIFGAITINSILFASAHLPDIDSAISALILGITSCLLISWSRSILLPILLHFSVNLFWYVGKYHYKLSYFMWAAFEFKPLYIGIVTIGLLTVVASLINIYKVSRAESGGAT